ncbi:cytosine deaminase [Fusarium heterosporum]|uniref:Cytosine deaminase n=1 Tax=Fusarium heterosporum TaxID=42747 RepID=A0A8H5SQG8_FUSHE|nr:cytosine deaminase [Fusarium heterosporum]
MNLANTILPFQEQSRRWDIQIKDGVVVSMKASDETSSQPPNILLPALCHPHIHLDKPYLLTCNHPSSQGHPDYSDLVPKTGSFDEALTNTSEAKKRYTPEDLYLRGSQLLATSYAQGVSCMRAFVELDHVTKLQPLKTAIRLKKEFDGFVDLQICAFAQDPIFSTDHGEHNRSILEDAIHEFGSWIEVIGTTPYVESDDDAQKQNIRWAIKSALTHKKHLDFHMEFNLKEGDCMEQFNYIIDEIAAHSWPTHPGAPTVVLGHATRLTLASHTELTQFAERLRTTKLPVHFVGLPTSDLFMMGRPSSDNAKQDAPLSRPCGTLQVPKMIQDYGLNACLSVNNVGNAFTPYGTGDPLGIASWGVGIFHAGRVDDARLLYEAVSTRAMDAIRPSEVNYEDKCLNEDGKVFMPMLLLRNEESVEISTASGQTLKVPSRQRLSIKDVVWDPPETRLRSVIR